MKKMLKISWGTNLAIHSMALLAGRPQRVMSRGALAKALGASEFNISKVLQNLHKRGYLEASKGPHGGYKLARPADQITLMEVYESIEGKFEPECCLLGKSKCPRKSCILGGLVKRINKELKDYLVGTKVSDLARQGGRASK